MKIMQAMAISEFLMKRRCHYFNNLVLGFFLLALSQLPVNEAQNELLVSALYVFGDSTIDPGNNNELVTIVKANFPPYGRNFPNGRPTGRFTNGRLVTDIISELAGLPDLLPAFSDPEFQGEKLLTGASFGSAGSGYTESTSLSFNLIPLEKQVDNFRYYRAQLAKMLGQKNASKIVSEGLFAISSGTNDFVNNYYTSPLMSTKYSVAQFQDLLLQTLSGFIQNVYNEGGTRLAIIGVPPFGCLPSQITLLNLVGNTCVEEFNEVARSFNTKGLKRRERDAVEQVCWSWRYFATVEARLVLMHQNMCSGIASIQQLQLIKLLATTYFVRLSRC